ncbi:protein NCBP2AS2 homolog [Ornithodoros turicata]|uniref:Putative mediator of rna polymerase ii transcription subunit 9-like isoform x2 n=1 Tax=Ornithodoros turicata TaxID=34597 RepID=A0A2R5LDP0_9ACAR
MVFRILLRYLVNNEQLIQRLADSYPFRRAAQLTAHFMIRGKSLSQESMEMMSTSELFKKFIIQVNQASGKVKQFSSEKIEKLEEAIKDIKKRRGL